MKNLILLFILLLMLISCKIEKPVKDYELFEQDGFTVIKTKADNIKPETIRAPICSDYVKDLGYYGINAGFFNTVYKTEPENDDFISVSISWSKEDAKKGLEVSETSKRDWERIALGESPYISRGTLYLYINENQYEAGVISAETCDDLKKQINQDYDYIYMIGGGNFYLSDYPNAEDFEAWENEKYLGEGPLVIETSKTGRTGIGIKKEDNIWYTYLAASGTNGEEIPKTLEELRALFISLGCSGAIYLDGAGSSQMRCVDNTGELIEKPGDNRYIWAMVRLINTNG